MQTCFPPVTRADTRLIVVGSLPGAVSLAERRYYAHPRNQFWRLIGEVIEKDLIGLEYQERLEALLEGHVGLWDAVAEGRREGSLDSAIRLHRSTDLAALADTQPQLRAIAFNGGTAARIGRKALAGRGDLHLLDLPSSSPAHTLPFEAKLRSWLQVRPYL